MKHGDKVRTRYGNSETVMTVANDLQVYTYENKTGWYHPGNLTVIKTGATK